MTRSKRRAGEVVFGFRVVMMSDAVPFGRLIATYAAMVGATPGDPGPADLSGLRGGAIGTKILLTDSFTFRMTSLNPEARAGHGARPALDARHDGSRGTGPPLELLDLRHMSEKGETPSRSGFVSAFFGLVPLRGPHVTLGIVRMPALPAQIAVPGMDDVATLVMRRLGLFRHVLDIVRAGIVHFGGLAVL